MIHRFYESPSILYRRKILLISASPFPSFLTSGSNEGSMTPFFPGVSPHAEEACLGAGSLQTSPLCSGDSFEGSVRAKEEANSPINRLMKLGKWRENFAF